MKWLFTVLLSLIVLSSCEDITLRDIKSVNDFQLSSIQKVVITNDNGLFIAGIADKKITFF